MMSRPGADFLIGLVPKCYQILDMVVMEDTRANHLIFRFVQNNLCVFDILIKIFHLHFARNECANEVNKSIFRKN